MIISKEGWGQLEDLISIFVQPLFMPRMESKKRNNYIDLVRDKAYGKRKRKTWELDQICHAKSKIRGGGKCDILEAFITFKSLYFRANWITERERERASRKTRRAQEVLEIQEAKI